MLHMWYVHMPNTRPPESLGVFEGKFSVLFSLYNLLQTLYSASIEFTIQLKSVHYPRGFGDLGNSMTFKEASAGFRVFHGFQEIPRVFQKISVRHNRSFTAFQKISWGMKGERWFKRVFKAFYRGSVGFR